MQVFKAFMKVLKKKMIIAFIYIWVLAVIAVAMVVSGSGSSMFEQTSMRICVFDGDNTPESRALCDFLDMNNELVTLENDRDTILDALYYDRVDYVLTIKKGYAEKLAAGNADDLFESMKLHDSYSSVYTGQLLNEYAGTVCAFIAGGNDISSSVTKAADVLSREAEVNVASFGDTVASDLSPNAAFYFRYLAYVLLGAVMNSLCPVLLKLGKKDIRFRTNCSGLRPGSYMAQIFAASVIYITAVWLVFMMIGVFINGGMYTGQAWLAVLNSFVFTLFAAALTVFVASFDPSSLVINILTQVVTLLTSFLCGVFIQQEFLGEGVLAAARFMPTYWYIRVNRMLEGSEPMDTGLAVTALLIELAFAAVFAVLTVLVRSMKYSGVRTQAKKQTA